MAQISSVEIDSDDGECILDQTSLGFPALLRSFRERAGRSRNSLAHEVGVDPSYLTRIEHGDREPPRSHIIEAVARVLQLAVPDRNRLLIAAGYAPISIVQLGSWDDALQAVTDVLNDLRLSPEERDAFRQIVIGIAKHWQVCAICNSYLGVKS